MRTGPAFDEPRSLAEQLEASVANHQCEAITGVHTSSVALGSRCEELDTKLHPTLERRLCWLHRHAADNFRRTTQLRFVEKQK